MSYFDCDEWMRLDNFLRTRPAQKTILKYFYDHPDREHTVESLARDGLTASFLDLKALVVYRLLTACDRDGHPVTVPLHLRETARFRLAKEKIPLIRATLEKRKLRWDENRRVIWDDVATPGP